MRLGILWLLAVIAATSLVPVLAGSVDVKTLEREAVNVEPGIDPPKLSVQTQLEGADSPSGTVTIKALIDATGEVRKVTVLESSSHHLKRLATEAMLSRRYEPARKNGQPIAVWWTTTLRFHSAQELIDQVLTCDPAVFGDSAPVMPTPDMELPRMVRDVHPVVSDEMRRHFPGNVVLQCHINVCGRVDSCDVRQTTGPEFTEAAQKAALQRLYTPAMQKGRPVAIYFLIRFNFRMG